MYICVLTGHVYAEYVPGELIVKYKKNADSVKVRNLHANIASVKKREFKKINIHHIKLQENMSVEEAIEYYRQDPNVEYAEPNYIVHATATPDDLSGNLWGLHNTGQSGGTVDADIDAPEAWDIATGSADVVIAVIDSGIAYNHPDLADNIWTNPGETSADCLDGVDNNGNGNIDECIECFDNIDNDGNGKIDDSCGWDFNDNDNDPTDYNSHGTHVAGTIAAVGDNSQGITGVMWQAKIMPLRFLGINGSGTTSAAIAAIEYARDNGAHIINNSWGGSGFSQALKDAIDASPDVLVVCATGNSGLNSDIFPFYPASFSSNNIISVAATDRNDILASFSNYGSSSVDLAAPGKSTYSSIPTFSYGGSVPLVSTDFDSDTVGAVPSGWESNGTNNTWAVNDSEGVGGTNSLEDSPGGDDYIIDTNSWVGYSSTIPSIKNNRYLLSFQWKGKVDVATSDYLYINYSSNKINWDWADRINGDRTSGYTTYSSNEITIAADLLDNFYFAFGLVTGSSGNYDGVYIDNVSLSRQQVDIASYSYGVASGTSMAAPHVSGVAGLIKSLNAGITDDDMKNAILTSVDTSCSLENKVSAKGRLNAFNALLVSQGDNAGLSETLDCSPPVASSGGGGGGGGGGGCFIKSSIHKNSSSSYIHELRRLINYMFQ